MGHLQSRLPHSLPASAASISLSRAASSRADTERSTEPLRALQRIATVEITHTARQQKTFVIYVYYKRVSRIPVVSSRAIALSTTAPSSSPHASDIHVERTFREIRRLRDAVYDVASNDHGITPCAYCPVLFDFTLQKSTSPCTAKQWLQNDETLRASLTAFLQQLLGLAVQVKKTVGNGPCGCHGQQRIRKLLSEFLNRLPPKLRPRRLSYDPGQCGARSQCWTRTFTGASI